MTDEKKPDLAALQDRIVELAKDLVMLDTLPLMDKMRDGFDDADFPPFASYHKRRTFRNLIVAVHAAKGCAEEFRQAHIDEERASLRANMEAQVAERPAEIDRDDIAARRAS